MIGDLSQPPPPYLDLWPVTSASPLGPLAPSERCNDHRRQIEDSIRAGEMARDCQLRRCLCALGIGPTAFASMPVPSRQAGSRQVGEADLTSRGFLGRHQGLNAQAFQVRQGRQRRDWPGRPQAPGHPAICSIANGSGGANEPKCPTRTRAEPSTLTCPQARSIDMKMAMGRSAVCHRGPLRQK